MVFFDIVKMEAGGLYVLKFSPFQLKGKFFALGLLYPLLHIK